MIIWDADPIKNGSLLRFSTMKNLHDNLKEYRQYRKLAGCRAWNMGTSTGDSPRLRALASISYPTDTTKSATATVRCEIPKDLVGNNQVKYNIQMIAYVGLYLNSNSTVGDCTGQITDLQMIHANSSSDAYRTVLGPQSFRFGAGGQYDSIHEVVLTGEVFPRYRLGSLAAENEELWLNLICKTITLDQGVTSVPRVAYIQVYFLQNFYGNDQTTYDNPGDVSMTLKNVESAVDANYSPDDRYGWRSIIHANALVYRYATEQLVNAMHPRSDDTTYGYVTGYPATCFSTTYRNIMDNVTLASSQAEMYLNVKGRKYDGTNARVLLSFYFQKATANFAFKVEWKPMLTGSWASCYTSTDSASTAGWQRFEFDIPAASNDDILVRVSAKRSTAGNEIVRTDAMGIRFYHASIVDAVG